MGVKMRDLGVGGVYLITACDGCRAWGERSPPHRVLISGSMPTSEAIGAHSYHLSPGDEDGVYVDVVSYMFFVDSEPLVRALFVNVILLVRERDRISRNLIPWRDDDDVSSNFCASLAYHINEAV